MPRRSEDAGTPWLPGRSRSRLPRPVLQLHRTTPERLVVDRRASKRWADHPLEPSPLSRAPAYVDPGSIARTPRPPAITEKPIASGMRAPETTIPDRTSARMFENQSRRSRVVKALGRVAIGRCVSQRSSSCAAKARGDVSGALRDPADWRPEEPPGLHEIKGSSMSRISREGCH